MSGAEVFNLIWLGFLIVSILILILIRLRFAEARATTSQQVIDDCLRSVEELANPDRQRILYELDPCHDWEKRVRAYLKENDYPHELLQQLRTTGLDVAPCAGLDAVRLRADRHRTTTRVMKGWRDGRISTRCLDCGEEVGSWTISQTEGRSVREVERTDIVSFGIGAVRSYTTSRERR